MDRRHSRGHITNCSPEKPTSTKKLALAADSADAGLWEYDCATSLFWSTKQARKKFNYQPEDMVGDRDQAKKAVQQHFTEIMKSMPAIANEYPEFFDDLIEDE
jgi:hypothetical protein